MPKTNSDAEAAYWDADEKLGVAHNALIQTQAAADRARLLYKMHRAEERAAWVFPAAFGPDPMEDEGGRDLSESLAFTAVLYGLLADVEQAIAYPGMGGRRNTTTVLERQAGEILDRMAATADSSDGLAERMRMLDELIAAVVDTVGGEAAESLWCLPAPGMVGPHTLAERDDWLAERGCGYGPASFGARMERIVPWLLLAGVVVVFLYGAFMIVGGLLVGSWWHVGTGVLLGIGIPALYIRRRLSARRFLAEPTEYDTEDEPGFLGELDETE